MSDTTFRFRQFMIQQDKCAMKVGTDGVLLGSWVNPGEAHSILDIGTGTGLIALMLAQKSAAQIDAVDIDSSAYCQAKENFRTSPWFNRVHAHHQSFQEFSVSTKKKYDLIVSNPPYFHHASKPYEEARLHARHNDQLSFTELISGVKNLLSEHGRFCVILPCREGSEFMDEAQRSGLYCNEMMHVKTKSCKLEKRLMMEFSRELRVLNDHEMIIQDEDCSYTEKYIEMTKEYFIGLK